MSRYSGASATSGQQVGPPPAWILLDMDAVVADRRNATTASALTSRGRAIHVTLVAADPPRDSYLCVQGETVSMTKTRILYSWGDLVLLSVPLPGHAYVTDHFIYCKTFTSIPPCTFTMLPSASCPPASTSSNDGTAGKYMLHVFRSHRGAWESTTVELGSEVCLRKLEKVIPLGRGELGWVDLRRGILVCDVLDDDGPKPRAIPLPKLLPSNRLNLWRRRQEHHRPAREYRDVVVCAADGSIRCVEMEHQMRRSLPEIVDVSAADVLHDSDLPMDRCCDDDNTLAGGSSRGAGRPLRTAGEKERLVHVADILKNDPGHTSLLREMGGFGGEPDLTVAKLEMDVPFLSVDGGDVVYFMSRIKDTDTMTWAVAVDMEKTLVDAKLAPGVCFMQQSGEESQQAKLASDRTRHGNLAVARALSGGMRAREKKERRPTSTGSATANSIGSARKGELGWRDEHRCGKLEAGNGATSLGGRMEERAAWKAGGERRRQLAEGADERRACSGKKRESARDGVGASLLHSWEKGL
ncbi:hypothetical protein HU200_003795 [Digitaria exilis]|uniref:DUF1618 domain-containing protein n=1 Tax=Digitaria exilis TaxID=1010633 RepID=A0A835KXY9_9POAL|nr:hypothetical protein HU200_003795 [Digitaria exilis]